MSDVTGDDAPGVGRMQAIAAAAVRLRLQVLRSRALADGVPVDARDVVRVLTLGGAVASLEDIEHWELCTRLIDGIGATLTRTLMIGRASPGGRSALVDEQALIARLDAAVTAWRAIDEVDGPVVACIWMTSSNIWLSGESPIDALLGGGDLDDFRRAVRAFIDGTWSG